METAAPAPARPGRVRSQLQQALDADSNGFGGRCKTIAEMAEAIVTTRPTKRYPDGMASWPKAGVLWYYRAVPGGKRSKSVLQGQRWQHVSEAGREALLELLHLLTEEDAETVRAAESRLLCIGSEGELTADKFEAAVQVAFERNHIVAAQRDAILADFRQGGFKLKWLGAGIQPAPSKRACSQADSKQATKQPSGQPRQPAKKAAKKLGESHQLLAWIQATNRC